MEGLLKRSPEIKDNLLFQIKAIISVPSKGTSGGKKTLVHQYSPWKKIQLSPQNIDNIVLLQNKLLFCNMTMLHSVSVEVGLPLCECQTIKQEPCKDKSFTRVSKL